MNRLIVIAALAAAPLACVANQGDAPIRFLNARALEFTDGEGCSGSSEFFISEGLLDISAGSNFLLSLSVETNTRVQAITIGGEDFSDNGPGDITLNEVIYSYESEPPIPLPADDEDRVPIYAVFRPQSSPDSNSLFVRAFGPEALAILKSVRSNFSVESPLTVLVTIKARGRMSGGQVVESNKFTFPITVFSSVPGGFTGCPAGQIASGVCGIVGQGGPIVCTDP